MKILNLTIENIHSLKGKHTIHFNQKPLADTGIFAIIGPTGSGKSTILDAICLALFNQTPRTGKLSKSEVANYGSIMTRNTKAAMAELTYSVNQITYRSKWTISVARTGSLREYDMELVRIDGEKEEILPLKRKDIPNENSQIIGLNFDQFIKSMMLSQGAFTKFIEASPNERGELLEKITGTEIYRRIGIETFEKNKVELQKLVDLKGQLELLHILTPEELKELEEEKERLSNEAKKVNSELTLLQNKLNLLHQKEESEKSISKTRKNRDSIEEEKKRFAPNLTLIQQHEKIQPYILDIENHKQLLKRKEQQEQTIHTLEGNKKELQEKITVEEAKYNTLQKRLLDIEKQIEDLKPVWDKTIALDKKLSLINDKIISLDKDLNTRKKNLNQREKEIIDIKQQTKELEKETEKQQQTLKNKTQIENYAKNISLVQNSWEQYIEQKEQIDLLLKKNKENTTVKNLINQESIPGRTEVLQGAIEQANAFIKENKNKLIHQDPNKATELSLKIKEMMRQLSLLKSVEEKIIEYKKQIGAKQEEVVTFQRQNKKASEEKEKKSDELRIDKLKLKELQLRLQREILESKYEQDRVKLSPNTPCPLCGSHDHPYTNSNPTHDAPSTEQEITKINNSITVLEKQHQQVQNIITQTTTSIEQWNRLIQQWKDEIIKLNQQKEQIPFLENLEYKEDILSSILQKEETLSLELKTLEEEEKRHRWLDQASLRKTFISDLLQRYQQLSATHQQLMKLLELENTEKDAIISQKIQSIQQLIESYEKAVEQKRILDLRSKELATKQKGLLIEANKENEDIQQLNKIYLAQKEESQKRSKERQGLLEDKDPQKDAEKWNDIKAKQKEDISKCEKEQAITKEKYSATIVQQKKETEESELILKSLEEDKTKIDHILSSLDIDSIVGFEKLKLSSSRYNTLKDEAKTLHDRQIMINEQITQLELQHQRIDKELGENIVPEQWRSQKLVQENEITSLHKSIGVLEDRINKNNENTKASSSLLEEIKGQTKESNKWQNLTELIGDASGNKFAKYAQELTLRKLLYHANKHLKDLTDRYWIEYIRTEKIDDLFIVDTYHGDATRAVKTLSGGEKFIVSLSLAIALSELAGRNTQIESLFIDEGFGTLDQDALDVALNALEKLQIEQNRTIGIISHVKEIKERITTQIALQKQSNGYSTLDIH